MTELLVPALESGTRSAFIAGLRDVEFRASGNGEEFTFTGSAVVFNSWSERLWTPAGYFRERILPQAFDSVLAQQPDVRLLINHDSNLVLARTRSGTLELTVEEDALRVWARVAPTSYAQDLRMSMERGDIDQMSFAFELEREDGGEDRWYEGPDGEFLRDIVQFSGLLDVSPVTYPAYPETSAAMRSLEAARASGTFVPLVARAETDPVGHKTAPDDAPAETDPEVTEERDAGAPAETDPEVSGHQESRTTPTLAELKRSSRAARNTGSEVVVRLSKEAARHEHLHEGHRGRTE